MTQEEIIASLPTHLRPFVRTQDYGDYTPRDQAVWRFVMKHLTAQLAASAHPVYLEGLARTGIALDHIPTIDEMNHCLEKLGWRAVVVDGFIPPAIFMEFQALKVLVIAVDMRSIDHIFYTPAPDILHESAGHAPFIVDIDYAEFLQRFGEIGMKAITTREDIEIYEAIRKLSILKECPDSDACDIEAAESGLTQLLSNDSNPSEAALLARLHWWTVEYGLVGTEEDYRIFGAGLLSSLGESRHCLSEDVEKIPLTVAAVLAQYDITREQPRLFVTRSCKHLTQVLEEFAASMCFRRGGAESLRTAVNAGSICTASYDSGVQVSGVFDRVLCDAVGNPIYLHTTGPTQIAYRDREVPGHGVAHHAQGFGSPIGRVKDFNRCLSEYTVDELKSLGITRGEAVSLEYVSGVTVQGTLREIHRQDQQNLILSLSDCLVTDLCGLILFDPTWGSYDLAVGAAIVSVYGGVADRETLPLYKPTPRTTTIKVIHDERLMSAYAQLDRLRIEQGTFTRDDLAGSLGQLLGEYPNEWLLRAELLELAESELQPRLHRELTEIASRYPDLAAVIELACTGTQSDAVSALAESA